MFKHRAGGRGTHPHPTSRNWNEAQMNRNRWPTSHTSPRHDPVLLAIQAACAVAVVVLVLLLHGMLQHAQAVAAHPCPPARIVMLAPTGWGCGDSFTGGVKTR